MKRKNLSTVNQSGFRPGNSTTNQLLFLVNEIHEAFENPKCLEIRAVFLDISKAFDKVWHDGLVFKLKQNGITGNLLKLFKNYLQDRKQRVVLNGTSSEYSLIESGVPQGSVLGPLLFLIYINDLEKDLISNVKFFADDTMLYSVVQDPIQTANELNHDLQIIQDWAYQWKMSFNPDPTKQAKELLSTRERISPDYPNIIFNGCTVTKVNDHKHLGLVLQSNLSFEKHLEEKIYKAKRVIGLLKHFSKFLPLRTLDMMYKTLARPHFDYCDLIYHIPPISTETGLTLHRAMEKVEKTQYVAALSITGAWHGSSRSKIYDELGWETLSDRRLCKRILQVHKLIDDKAPRYLKEKLPPNRNNFLPYVFQNVRCRTECYKSSFYPNATYLWNEIISDFENLPTFDSLKSHLLSFFDQIRNPCSMCRTQYISETYSN